MEISSKWMLITFIILVQSVDRESYAQQVHVDVGIRSQKTIGLYLENGLATQWTLEKLACRRLYLGLGFVSSRLGTAWGTNAIKQDYYQLSFAYYLRKDRKVRPFASLTTGYFHADYEEAFFEVLDNESMLLDAGAGVQWELPLPLKLNAALGYRLISGNGERGPGTLYPIYAQLTIYYSLK